MRIPLTPTMALLVTSLWFTAQAQELSWRNPGDFDYAAHHGNTPADPTIPEGIPPGFAASIAHPAALKLKVTGMDFLPDGRMALAHWDTFGSKLCMIYLLEGVSGAPEAIKATVIARNIFEPFGLKVVDGEIHYTAQDGLWKLVKRPSGPETWDMVRVANFIIPGKEGGAGYPIFNTAYHAGAFYYSNGAYWNWNPRDKNQGYVVRFDLATGTQEILGRGIRMPNGLAVNSAGDPFFSDNQGEYRPSSSIFHVVKGRHYGMAAPDGREGNMQGAMTRFVPLPPADSIFPPAVQVPYRPGSASLTNMFLLDHTPFAGQFLVGDNAYGAVHRVQVEKVKGEYQGASFQFSGVLEAGIQSFAKGPDGAIYGGALGMTINGWHWLNRETGLMKWKLDGKSLDAISRVSSQREGFDLGFTEALGADAANPNLYWVNSYRYQPTSSYGGPRLDMRRHRVTRIRTSPDRRTVALTIEGLEAKRIYRIILSPGLKTVAGATLWTRNAWYTLNQINTEVDPLGTGLSLSIPPRSDPPQADFLPVPGRNRLQVRIREAGPFSLRVLDARGASLSSLRGMGPATVEIGRVSSPSVSVLVLATPSGSHSRLLGPDGR